jgi:hypothetical protein
MRKSQAGIEREDAKSSNDPLKQEYEDYLRNQRGLSDALESLPRRKVVALERSRARKRH